MSGDTRKISALSQALAVQRERTRQLERLEYLLRMSPAVIYTVDPADPTGATFVSARVQDITGFTPDDFVRTPGLWLDLIHPDDLPLIASAMQEIFAHDGLTLDYRVHSKGGDYRWVRDSAVLVRDSRGEPVEFIGSWLDITDVKAYESQLRHSETQLHALAARLQAVREDERTRLAREVHDVLGQLLTALTMDIAWLGRRLAQVDDTALRTLIGDKLGDMGSLTSSMIRSVQRITSELRPSILDNLGLAAAIRFEAGCFQSRTEIHCVVELPNETTDLGLDPDRITGLFRILQELLTNVARHAAATRVTIRLVQDDGWIALDVADDGRGITPDQLDDPRSMGLLGMRERVAQMGGEILFTARPGAGTQVRVRVPT